MFEPNLYTIVDDGQIYGLHRFKSDGQIILAVQHSSGDWVNLRPARASEEKHFAEHGDIVVKK